MRAVIYCRVSTKDQVQNLSLSTQQRACIEYCQRNDYAVDKVFIEEGESAKTADRTELQKLLAYCRENKGRISAVVVYAVSRFARERLSHAVLRAQLASLGITLRSATEPIDDSSTGKLIEGMVSTLAQWDNDVRSERTVAGMKARLERGEWTFPPPLGYMKATHANGAKHIELDPQRAPLIAQAFEMLRHWPTLEKAGFGNGHAAGLNYQERQAREPTVLLPIVAQADLRGSFARPHMGCEPTE